MRLVPNYIPFNPTPNRIAFIGEAPGFEEEREGTPFVGQSGRLLRSLCNSVGIPIERCFIGNVCQVKPPENEIAKFAWNGEEMSLGREQLAKDIQAFDPNIVVLLGNTALHLAKSNSEPRRRVGKIVWPFSVSDWRGSIFVCDVVDSPLYGRKCLASYHPATCLRQYEWVPVLRMDLNKAYKNSHDKFFKPPVRQIDINVDFDHIISRLQRILDTKPLLTMDIEGGVRGIKCVSFAESNKDVFIVPFTKMDGTSFWPELEQEVRVWQLVSAILYDPQIGKVLQNSLYDNFVLSYTYKTPIVNVVDDTMLAHWELFCELEKNLGFQASVYTNEPYYKGDIAASDSTTFWTYCCRDSAISREIREVLNSRLDGSSRTHYRFNVDLLPPVLYMELKGIRYDESKAASRQAELQKKCNDYLEKLYMISGRPIATSGVGFTKFLYDELGLPEVLNRKTGARTANYEALLRLIKKTNHPACHLGIRLRALKTRIQMLNISADGDGRIRCGYNLVGTETGRITCYTSPTGSGYNLQTIPEYDRDLFLPDPGYHFFQCDLSGADGWTVAAYCAALGDSTMLEDYLTGLKPAKLLALGLRHGPNVMSIQERPRLLEMSKEIKKEDWQYFVSKIGQHGSNYLMGSTALANNILIQSEGKVVVTPSFCDQMQYTYFKRYPGVKRWHNWMAQELKTHRRTFSASGHVRQYFGRTEEILGAALANEPQENTTYATNLALHRLWYDPENRVPNVNPSDGSRGSGSLLRIQPLHQVHDALCGQFKVEDAQWAVGKIKSYFNNKITIAGVKIKIPFEGRYGSSWGKLEHSI